MANLQISNLSQSTSDRRPALTFRSPLTDSTNSSCSSTNNNNNNSNNNNHHHHLNHQRLIVSSSSHSSNNDNIVGNSDETLVQQPSALQPSSSGSGIIKAKKRKMANELNFSNDSGIPMEGVELDSSTVSLGTNSPINHPLASTTDSTLNLSTPLSSADSNMANNNEALASDSPGLSQCDETKGIGTYSPDYGASGVSDDHNNSLEDACYQNSQHDKGGQSGYQNNFIRNFGDLFDDDDLD